MPKKMNDPPDPATFLKKKVQPSPGEQRQQKEQKKNVSEEKLSAEPESTALAQPPFKLTAGQERAIKLFLTETKSVENVTLDPGMTELMDDISSLNVESKSSRKKGFQFQWQGKSLRLSVEQRQSQSKKHLARRRDLPAYRMSEDILFQIQKHSVLIITGETGCGKSTQVPQLILEDALKRDRSAGTKIVCMQPRKVAAVSLSQRVAAEQGERGVGRNSSVGYQVMWDNCQPLSTGSILYCTSGIVLQMLKSDPQLKKVSHLILDEVHERSINDDFVMTVVQNLLMDNSHLKVILMSATANTKFLSGYFNNCPVFQIPGISFPVKEFYLEDILEQVTWNMERRRLKEKSQDKEFRKLVKPKLKALEGHYMPNTISQVSLPSSEYLDMRFLAKVVKYIHLEKKAGAILVFLPGWFEIKLLLNTFQNQHLDKVKVVPLHSGLLPKDQLKAFEHPPEGTRKIVLATNIAESSITIDDIVYVVDCGRANVNHFSFTDNVGRLNKEWITKAGATQRKGRAGRTQPGQVFRVYTRARMDVLEPHHLPEILRSRLESVILSIMHIFTDVRQFFGNFPSPPSPEAIDHGIASLQAIGALDKTGCLTLLGSRLADLPLNPGIGKMLLYGAIFSCLDPVLSIAARLDNQMTIFPGGKNDSALQRDLARETMSDHLFHVEVMRRYNDIDGPDDIRDFCESFKLSRYDLDMVCYVKWELANVLFKADFVTNEDPQSPASNVNSCDSDVILACVMAGMYPNVALLDLNEKRGKLKVMMPDGKMGRFHPLSVLGGDAMPSTPAYVTYFRTMKGQGLNSNYQEILDASLISPMCLSLFGRVKGQNVVRSEHWDLDQRKGHGKGNHGQRTEDSRGQGQSSGQGDGNGQGQQSQQDQNQEKDQTQDVEKMLKRVRKRLNQTVAELLERPQPNLWATKVRGKAKAKASVERSRQLEVLSGVVDFLGFHGRI